MKLIDADKFLAYLIFSKHIDSLKCGEVKEAVEKCRVDVLDDIKSEIKEEKEMAYADFEQYKVDYLGIDAEYVEDELPDDEFRYGMERCLEIINKYMKEGE